MRTHPAPFGLAPSHADRRGLTSQAPLERGPDLGTFEIHHIVSRRQPTGGDEPAPDLKERAAHQPHGQTLGIEHVLLALRVHPLGDLEHRLEPGAFRFAERRPSPRASLLAGRSSGCRGRRLPEDLQDQRFLFRHGRCAGIELQSEAPNG